jgi:predicted short-subunit dehydrogenase-like oxidoreductase (DUF2520 family)
MTNEASLGSFNLVGGGRLGCTLGRAFVETGVFSLKGLVSRSLHSAELAVLRIGAGQAFQSIAELASSQVVMLAVTDDALAEVARALIGRIAPGTVVFHCSGAQSSNILDDLRAQGALVASAHPMMTFSGEEEPGFRLDGVFCALEGDPLATALLSRAFSRLGGKPALLDSSDKVIYHASAVFACNYVTTLLEVSQQILHQVGLEGEDALAAIRPLVQATLANVWKFGPERALTGPIARGDAMLVQRQFEALKVKNTEWGELYVSLAHATARLAKRSDPLATIKELSNDEP